MANYFEITFQDLSFEKQQDLIETVKGNLLEQWKEEVEKDGKDWKGNTWQEKFMRMYAVDYNMWDDDGDVERPYDWEYGLTEYAEEEAEKKLIDGFRHLEVEVEL